MDNEYFRVIFNLLIVVSLIVISLLFVKKIKTAKYIGKKNINIVNIVPIGTKEKIILLELNNTMLLIGVTASNIQTLHSYPQVNNSNQEAVTIDKPNFLEIMKGTIN